MTEQNQKVDGRTRRAADIALAKRTISRASYDAILAGTLSLQEGKEYGRNRGPDCPEGRSGLGRSSSGTRSASAGDTEAPQDAPPRTPPQPVSRMSKDDATQACWCGCRSWASPGKRWRPGHDQRAKGIIKRAVREGKTGELSPQLREYGAERGLL